MIPSAGARFTAPTHRSIAGGASSAQRSELLGGTVSDRDEAQRRDGTMTSTRVDPPQGPGSEPPRRTAGERLRPVEPSVTSLMHSLEVHQLELEVQNDQLRLTNAEL